MHIDIRHRLRAGAVAALVAALAGCGSEQAAVVGAPVVDEVADLTVVSDDQQVTTGSGGWGSVRRPAG